MQSSIKTPACSADSRSVARPPVSRPELLRRFLQAYWLRPENALWMTLRSEALSAVCLETPCIDLSCGDGVFTFLHCGGVFDPVFDVFTAVDRLDRVRDEHVDMFDCADSIYQPRIRERASQSIDVGTDLKSSLLVKAKTLGFYDRLVEHDNNTPLPFEDSTFQTVYCNAAYWVTEVDLFLEQINRVTQPGGRIVLHVKLDAMRRFNLGAHEAVLGTRFLEIIGRGRLDMWPTLAGRREWEDRFARAGLTIVDATPFVTRTHAHLWDIGLRPIAPMLVRMAAELTPETRASIKRDWVDLFCELLLPFCKPDVDLLGGHAQPAEIQYVLARTS